MSSTVGRHRAEPFPDALPHGGQELVRQPGGGHGVQELLPAVGAGRFEVGDDVRVRPAAGLHHHTDAHAAHGAVERNSGRAGHGATAGRHDRPFQLTGTQKPGGSV
ncbi:hypothetical protein [Streptomyces sp. NPDC006463]|uniref:hypothetical protein n=1 Tax=Streptomyces sp. NPDC006463 TaxID=3364746 RepID=UPI0036844933